MPDMTGRTVVITGGGRGIGLVVARDLATAGAHLVLAVRDVVKARRALAGVGRDVEFKQLDVADLDSVHAFAQSYTGVVDILINNAGVANIPAARTAQGLDVETATNYFGPFVLTNLLLPRVTDRVVSVSSQLHQFGRIHLDDLDWHQRRFRTVLDKYNASKLAIVLFSLELQRRLTAAGSPVRSIVAHPGVVRSELNAHSWLNIVNRFPGLVQDVEPAALPILYAATQNVPGNAYVGPDGLFHFTGHPVIHKPSRAARNPATAAALWQATASLTGIGGTVAAVQGRDRGNS
ncbi:SDR family NAD(P)-dependent oxidoreductase [Actinoplanes sp. URMC 104]|uniref:SDR family NAD(P)-dependent oxidoreductase n=1 Tax=Actinoplanes sp. URMC 104 TaxID=3423409 RepID=UPI003F1C6384